MQRTRVQRKKMQRTVQRKRLLRFGAMGFGAIALALTTWVGMAMAVSAPYNPSQNDCPSNADAWNTTANETYPGCHSIAINVESGGTTNGNANADNTRYAEAGDDQNGLDPNSQATPTVLGIGYPGNTGEPHAGCVSANTDGTDHKAAPEDSKKNDTPEPSGSATEDSPYGCGNNPKGAGFEANFDTYQYYCPIAAMAGRPCEDPSTPGKTTVTPDTGTGVDYQPIVQNGLLVYFGMDDNTDNGEHDGFDGCAPGTVSNRCAGTGQTNTDTNGAVNGPSDGGGLILSLTPQWLASPSTPSETNPEGILNLSLGFCADGICGGSTTQQNTIYYGCNPAGNSSTENGTDGATSPQNDKAADKCAPGTAKRTDSFENDTPSSTQESANCNGGGPYGGPSGTEAPCFTNVNGKSNGAPNTASNNGGANYYRQHTPQQVTDEPGVQIYQDPDPQRSPAAPFGTPGAYVGTCGVYLNDGGGYGEPGVSGLVTGGKENVDPGWVVEAPDPNC